MPRIPKEFENEQGEIVKNCQNIAKSEKFDVEIGQKGIFNGPKPEIMEKLVQKP